MPSGARRSEEASAVTAVGVEESARAARVSSESVAHEVAVGLYGVEEAAVALSVARVDERAVGGGRGVAVLRDAARRGLRHTFLLRGGCGRRLRRRTFSRLRQFSRRLRAILRKVALRLFEFFEDGLLLRGGRQGLGFRLLRGVRARSGRLRVRSGGGLLCGGLLRALDLRGGGGGGFWSASPSASIFAAIAFV